MYYYNTYYCYILSATRLFIIIIVSLIVQCPIMFSLNVIGVCNKHSKRMLQKIQYVYSLYIVEDGIQSKEQWLDNRKIIILLYIGTSLLQSPLGQIKVKMCLFSDNTNFLTSLHSQKLWAGGGIGGGIAGGTKAPQDCAFACSSCCWLLIPVWQLHKII